jgi:uncharacterized protein (TIRG00374 family)
MTPPSARSTGTDRRDWVITLVGVAVSIVAVVLVLSQADLGAALRLMSETDIRPVVFAVLVIITQLIVVSERWRLLLPPAAGRPANLLEVIRVVLVGYLGNLTLPGRLGEVIRSYLISRRHGMGLPETLGSVVLERAIDVAILAIVTFGFAALAGMPTWMLVLTGVAAILGGAFLLLVVTIGLVAPVAWIRRLLPERIERPLEPALVTVSRLASGASGHHRRTRIATAALLTVVVSIQEGVVFWACAVALGIPLDLPSAYLIAAVTILATAVPSAPGYLGTFHAAAVATAVALGVSADAALALAILAHFVTTIPLAVGGGLAALTLGVRLRPLADDARRAEEAGAT